MAIRDFTKFIKEHFGKTDDLIGVEIGVWQGDNAVTIKEYLNPKLLILVDAWNDRIEKANSIVVRDVENNCQIFGESQEKHLLYTYRHFADDINVIIIRGLSCDVAGLLGVVIDFGYVDASHDYEPVSQDIDCWYPLVRPGGVFGGHDYHMEGVARAVHESFSHKEIFIGKEDNSRAIDWWVIK